MAQGITFKRGAITGIERKVIEGGLKVNMTNKGIKREEAIPLSVIAYDGDKMLGGITGNICNNWLYIADLWVAEGFRNRGFGSKLLQEIERQAREAGIKDAYLWTASYEAPDFYRKHGYTQFCEFKFDPMGYSRLAFRKKL